MWNAAIWVTTYSGFWGCLVDSSSFVTFDDFGFLVGFCGDLLVLLILLVYILFDLVFGLWVVGLVWGWYNTGTCVFSGFEGVFGCFAGLLVWVIYDVLRWFCVDLLVLCNFGGFVFCVVCVLG